jgi:hypothetical protein
VNPRPRTHTLVVPRQCIMDISTHLRRALEAGGEGRDALQRDIVAVTLARAWHDFASS